MTLSFVRSFFVLVCGVVGYYIGTLQQASVLGAQIGCVSGLILIILEMQFQRVSLNGLSSMVFGLLLGVFMAKLLSNILKLLPLDQFTLSVSEIVLAMIFCYIGVTMALRGKDEFHIIIPYVRFKRQKFDEATVLLDTSAIIDGRVSKIYKSGFIYGQLLVPRFVLTELQALSDSANELKRQRGRRGIDLLRKMQDDSNVHIKIHDDEAGSSKDVDARLIELAESMDASICTTDYNLSRVAQVQDIDILNINELVSSLRPVLFSGDTLDVQLVKEGKEQGQAIAYLEDGTMIVVSDASDFIGQERSVIVTSVLQTQSGKMIFAKLIS